MTISLSSSECLFVGVVTIVRLDKCPPRTAIPLDMSPPRQADMEIMVGLGILIPRNFLISQKIFSVIAAIFSQKVNFGKN